ncbi:YafY family transcriptional regulator [Pseudomonas sp. 7P_10.2_Bac1]|uniref:helix-turn-helix transcriptional regulator n=1 Tax=Pseudomonas sp. 7P_10.2_Bac1 TaxID=2971614 RepID=UPI0021C7ED83|nr:YafY family protein [Pseudomonas sp. 7P_10.2_Bac1]MCU1726965.1 YafY family transcriptional regulator [Pseudomonas sp. 7P_10.2_Bac1]
MLTNPVSMPAMTRSERLLLLLQILRRHRYPVSGHVLAHETGVSLRTIYRDITALQRQGADIQGEPGIGYVLKPGFTLPPLMFTETELEALLLGLRWVSRRTDSSLSQAAADVESKIRAVLEPRVAERFDNTALFAGPGLSDDDDGEIARTLRDAIRQEQKVIIEYNDAGQTSTQRLIRPVCIGYFDGFRILAAWCELRDDFRHFRLARMTRCVTSTAFFTGQGGWLLSQWKIRNRQRGILEQPAPHR